MNESDESREELYTVEKTADAPLTEENDCIAPETPAEDIPAVKPNTAEYTYGDVDGANGADYSAKSGTASDAVYGTKTPLSSEISYSPAPEKKTKKKKPAKAAKLSTVIVVCVIAVILCGAVSFGGAYLAGRLVEESSAKDRQNTPLVIYKETAATAQNDTEAVSTDGNMTYVEVAALVKNTVVEINTEYKTQSAWFQYVDGGAGSGVIISEDGYVITNAHVIMNEDETAVADAITVRLADGSEYKARVIGYDIEADIGLLKIEAEGLTAAICGDSDTLKVGEELIVVGNPLGELGGSVSNGIVSATEREIKVNGTKMTLIQTNAAVNPGNSGGGMFNMNGQLVGIVNAKSAGTSIEGLGFAIPVNDMLRVSEQLMQYGYVKGKVAIGVKFAEVSQSVANYYNAKPGIYVESFTDDTNDGALCVGDRIIAVEGNEVTTTADIAEIIGKASVGDTLKFQLYRDSKLIEVEVKCFEKMPDDGKEKKNDDSSSDGNGGQRKNDQSGDIFGGRGGVEDYFFSDPFGGMDDFFDFFFGR